MLTKRHLVTRIKEHVIDINKRDDNLSVVSRHRLSGEHDFDWSNVRVLHQESHTKKREIAEMLVFVLLVQFMDLYNNMRPVGNTKLGLVEQYGYPAEEHYVTTADGYNLVIHRIPGSPLLNNKGIKKVAFIQHGILASSDSWVLFGPGKDLVIWFLVYQEDNMCGCNTEKETLILR
ncbi:Lipase [Ooceraea biroi]|uniref:Lipase n=1 Tax=Ooceraea biroi TaxID=2015173 RepID=A0A026WUU3_OOCBI|nr:Lipase [Ooceraea biroi]